MSVSADYYAALGVRRHANADEIKMAYRRLARELHPDVNPDPVSQERFKEITRAHEVLSDPGKRQMYDLGGDLFPAAGGNVGQARWEGQKQEEYPRDRREPHRERWPPRASDGAWKQSWDRAPYSAYAGGQPPSFSSDWRPPPAVKPHRPRPILQVAALICVVLALAVLVGARVVIHRAQSPHATPVTTTITIPYIDETWAPPPPDASPALTPRQAWLTYVHRGAGKGMIRARIQFGLILNQLAYGYYWTSCPPGTNLPATSCWNWLFLNAATGHVITAASYNTPTGPSP